MNSRCAASQFHHDSGSASTQFQHGSGCFKNVDGKKSKSSIMDGRCIGVPDVQPTEFNPARWKLNNYLYVMKNYFESFGNLVQQLIIDSESDNLPDPALFLQQLEKCEENLTKAVHDAAKAASYLKSDNKKKKRRKKKNKMRKKLRTSLSEGSSKLVESSTQQQIINQQQQKQPKVHSSDKILTSCIKSKKTASCKFYDRGYCKYGNRCKYVHECNLNNVYDSKNLGNLKGSNSRLPIPPCLSLPSSCLNNYLSSSINNKRNLSVSDPGYLSMFHNIPLLPPLSSPISLAYPPVNLINGNSYHRYLNQQNLCIPIIKSN